MRTFSNGVQALIDSNELDFFYLIELKLNNTYRFTTANYNMNYNVSAGSSVYPPAASDIWLSDGGVFSIEPPKINNILDREAYRVTLIDLSDVLLEEFNTNVIGKDITVWLGFHDSNGVALLNGNDIVQVYRGYVDSPSISNDWGTKVATIEGTSPMSDLDRVNSFITSRDGMDQIDATDTSFDNVFVDTALTVKWGKV